MLRSVIQIKRAKTAGGVSCATKIEKRGALEKASKIPSRCDEVLRFAVVTDREKYNFAPDLAIASNKPKQNHFPFLKEKDFPAFLKALKGYQGSLLTKYPTHLLMLTGVRAIEHRRLHGVSLIWTRLCEKFPKNG